jgi:hypothetical protein
MYGYKDDCLYGYIQLSNSKTLSAAETYIGYPTRYLEEKTKQLILEMEDVWEKGTPMKRGRKPVNKDAKDVAILCNFIMKQYSDTMEIVKHQLDRVESLQEENQQLREKYEASLKPVAPSIQQTIHDHSNNKKITNIQLFLNTECKDAITFQDFIRQIEISDDDMVCLKEHGYIESVSRLLRRELKNYDVFKRPLHCTDSKREVLHIKAQEGWTKESPQGESMDKAFRQISHKHTRKFSQFYPDISVESPQFEEKASVLSLLTRSTETNSKKKIIKNLTDFIHL